MKTILTAILIIFSLCTSCSKDDAGGEDTITYDVIAQSIISDVGYTDADGSITIETIQISQWNKTFKNTAGKPRVLTLSATTRVSGNTIKCTIKVNGKVVKTESGEINVFITYNLN
jgi:virulence-associated protein VapD